VTQISIKLPVSGTVPYYVCIVDYRKIHKGIIGYLNPVTIVAPAIHIRLPDSPIKRRKSILHYLSLLPFRSYLPCCRAGLIACGILGLLPGCGGSLAVGQWDPLRITLHLHNARVYEILNAIVAQNGRAIWTVTVSNLASLPQCCGLWYIYPLQEPFKSVVSDRLVRMPQ